MGSMPWFGGRQQRRDAFPVFPNSYYTLLIFIWSGRVRDADIGVCRTMLTFGIPGCGVFNIQTHWREGSCRYRVYCISTRLRWPPGHQWRIAEFTFKQHHCFPRQEGYYNEAEQGRRILTATGKMSAKLCGVTDKAFRIGLLQIEISHAILLD